MTWSTLQTHTHYIANPEISLEGIMRLQKGKVYGSESAFNFHQRAVAAGEESHWAASPTVTNLVANNLENIPVTLLG